MTAFLPLAQAKWGTVPDWLEAFGTLAAFAVALRLLAKELTARREYEEDRRRAQASRVICWLESVEDTTIEGDHLEVVIHNGSDEPVFDCRVWYESRANVELDPRTASTPAPDDPAGRLEPDLLAHVFPVTERFVPPGRTRRSLFTCL